MTIQLSPGKYILAVSGGVDSVVLLDLLSNIANLELIVAHFDHGIRSNSAEDRHFVTDLATVYKLPFEYQAAHLGPNTSEALARQARYSFLREQLARHNAKAIITAHHQDDVLETAIINLVRGTGRKGLGVFSDSTDIKRPLINFPKKDIVDYANQRNLKWREDPTNKDQKYLRNYVRHVVVPRFDEPSKQKFLSLIEKSRANNRQLDTFLSKQLGDNSKQLDRIWFNQLPHGISLETLAFWLRTQGIRDFDKTTLERLVVAAKTAQPGQRFDVLGGVSLEVSKDYLALRAIER